MRKIKNTLCLLLAMSMFTVLFACATKNELGILEKTDNNMVTFKMWGFTGAISTVYINYTTLKGEEGSEFVCSTSTQDPKQEGLFLLDSRTADTTVTTASGTTIYWIYWANDEEGMHISENETIWLEIVNRKDSQIIGYAVVKVTRIGESNYEPEVVKAVTFPKVNDEYQTVTEEQVNLLINNAEK